VSSVAPAPDLCRRQPQPAFQDHRNAQEVRRGPQQAWILQTCYPCTIDNTFSPHYPPQVPGESRMTFEARWYSLHPMPLATCTAPRWWSTAVGWAV